MSDGEDQYTDAQLQDGTTLRFKGQLTPDVVKQKVSDYKLKTGSGMMTPKAPAPQLPADAGAESPISSAHAQDASIMEATQKAHPVATSPKTIATAAGGIIGGGIAGPTAGLLTRSLATGLGMGGGTSVGQAATGENPIDPENLKESGKNALFGAGSEFGLGLVGKGIGMAGENPGLLRGMGRDAASKYVGKSLADAILPEPPPKLALPEGASTTGIARPGAPLAPPSGSGAMTSTGPPVRFGEPPPVVTPEKIMAQARTEALRQGTTAPGPWKPGRQGLARSPGTSLATRPGEIAGSPDDLISRTRAIVKPGEQPNPGDLKRAGDLTQAPLARLKTLAKYGDKLAENEVNRRLRNP
jgi:hypothetical protein